MTTATREYTSYRDEVLQFDILALVDRAGHRGMTAAEVRAHFDAEKVAHHGMVSGALSILHRDLKVARLSEKREGYKIYVQPDFLDSRKCEPQGHGDRLSKEEIASLIEIRDFMDYWFQVDTNGSRFGTDKTIAERNQRLFFTQAKGMFGDEVIR